MNILSTYIVDTPILDGFLLPPGYGAYSQSTVYKQLVVPNTTNTLFSIRLPTNFNTINSSSKIFIENVSDVSVRLITPTNPTNLDTLLLVNKQLVGIYQFVSGVWVYLGAVTASTLLNSKVGTNTSVGVDLSLGLDVLVTKVKHVDIMPQQLNPYTTYVDDVNNIIYFPYINALNMLTPLSVVSISSATLASNLLEGETLNISCSGYHGIYANVISGLTITYSGTIIPTINQPVAVYRKNVLISNFELAPTTNEINYALIDGATTGVAGGYYRGANNLWDSVTATHGVINSPVIFQLSPVMTSAVNILNLTLMCAASNLSNAVVYVYIGKPTNIDGSMVLFSKQLKPLLPIQIDNLRLAPGEAIFIKTSIAYALTYRYTQLSRSI